MTLLAYLAGSDEAHTIRLGALGLTSHSDGTVGFGSIVFDDPDGTLDVRGWMEVIVIEDECTDAPILFKGWIGDRIYSRTGASGTYRDGAARFIECNLVDQNEALTFGLITGADGKRPAEGHDERIAWILGSSYVHGLVADLGAVNDSPPAAFDEADYRGQYPIDVLTDLAGALTNATTFVYVDQPGGDFGLYFDFTDSTVGTSPLSISNVMSDHSSTCFYPFVDAQLHRDPSAVVSLVRFVYIGGAVVIETDPTTHDTFFSAAATGGLNIGNRGIEVSSDRIGRETTARSHADFWLDHNSNEHDTITVTVELPPDQSGLIDIGQRVSVRFTHLEGYESFIYSRVTARTIQQGITNQSYFVTLELDTYGIVGGGGGDPGDFPLPPPTLAQLSPVQVIIRRTLTPSTTEDRNSYPSSSHAWEAPTVGNLLILGCLAHNSTDSTVALPTPSGWTPAVAAYTTSQGGFGDNFIGRVFYKLADGSEVMFNPATGYEQEVVVLAEFDGPGTLVTGVSGGGANGPTAHASIQGNNASLGFAAMTTTAGQPVTLIGLFGQTGQTGLWDTSWGGTIDQAGGSEYGHPSDVTDSFLACALVTVPVTSSSGSERLTGTMYDNNDYPMWGVTAFQGASTTTTNPPSPGQIVEWTAVTMSPSGGVSVGTTAFPYASLSLQVKVDGVLISPASYTETDPATGDFALSWLLDGDETVLVKYLGSP